MRLKEIKPYLDAIIKTTNPKNIFEVPISDSEKYNIFFYQAVEFIEPCLFVCIIDKDLDKQLNTIIHYGMVLDNEIIYEENNNLPVEVKEFINKLVKLFSFI